MLLSPPRGAALFSSGSIVRKVRVDTYHSVWWIFRSIVPTEERGRYILKGWRSERCGGRASPPPNRGLSHMDTTKMSFQEIATLGARADGKKGGGRRHLTDKELARQSLIERGVDPTIQYRGDCSTSSREFVVPIGGIESSSSLTIWMVLGRATSYASGASSAHSIEIIYRDFLFNDKIGWDYLFGDELRGSSVVDQAPIPDSSRNLGVPEIPNWMEWNHLECIGIRAVYWSHIARFMNLALNTDSKHLGLPSLRSNYRVLAFVTEQESCWDWARALYPINEDHDSKKKLSFTLEGCSRRVLLMSVICRRPKMLALGANIGDFLPFSRGSRAVPFKM
eukprot:Gb_14434 [translate_table: standard]